MGTEYIEVPKCPKCAKPHRFDLDVERSVILKLASPMEMPESPRQARFTRLFTCPTKNEEFQVTFILTETSYDKITRVTVGGIADGAKP